MVGIIGAGGVGQALAYRLQAIGYSVGIVKRPHQALQGPFVLFTDWRKLPLEEISALFLCVRDQQIGQLAAELSGALPPTTYVFHTAGSVSLEELTAHVGKDRAGVVYPLQTFTPGRPVDWGEFPVLWEGHIAAREWAEQLTGSSDKVYFATTSERLRLHIGAVFTANFVNALFHIADHLVGPRWDRRIFLPLAKTVLEKLQSLTPTEAQTGPAYRGDVATLQKHLSLLENEYPELSPLYQLLSDYIREHIAQSSLQ